MIFPIHTRRDELTYYLQRSTPYRFDASSLRSRTIKLATSGSASEPLNSLQSTFPRNEAIAAPGANDKVQMGRWRGGDGDVDDRWLLPSPCARSRFLAACVLPLPRCRFLAACVLPLPAAALFHVLCIVLFFFSHPMPKHRRSSLGKDWHEGPHRPLRWL